MTQDRIPLDAESSLPAMEGETNELDARGLLYAETAVHFAGDDADAKALAEAAIRAYRKHSALPSAPAVEGVEPVIWVSEGQLHAMSPDCDDDSASGRYLPMRRSEGGNFKFPLYPASAISRLVKERDETTKHREDFRRMLMDSIARSEDLEARLQTAQNHVARLTALLAEADEVVKDALTRAEHKPGDYPIIPIAVYEALELLRSYQQKREAK